MEGIYFHFCNNLYQTNRLSMKLLNSEISSLSILLICLGHLEIPIALSNLNFNVRILIQDHFVVIISLL